MARLPAGISVSTRHTIADPAVLSYAYDFDAPALEDVVVTLQTTGQTPDAAQILGAAQYAVEPAGAGVGGTIRLLDDTETTDPAQLTPGDVLTIYRDTFIAPTVAEGQGYALTSTVARLSSYLTRILQEHVTSPVAEATTIAWTRITGRPATADRWPTYAEVTGTKPPAVPVTQAEAEAGTGTDPRVWTPERVKQAIDALASAGLDGSTLASLAALTNANVQDADGVLVADASANDAKRTTFAELDMRWSPRDRIPFLSELPAVAGYTVGDIVNVNGEFWRLAAGTDDRHVYHGILAEGSAAADTPDAGYIGDLTFSFDDDPPGNIRFNPLVAVVGATPPQTLNLRYVRPDPVHPAYDDLEVTRAAVEGTRRRYGRTAGTQVLDYDFEENYVGKPFRIEAYSDERYSVPFTIIPAGPNRWVHVASGGQAIVAPRIVGSGPAWARSPHLRTDLVPAGSDNRIRGTQTSDGSQSDNWRPGANSLFPESETAQWTVTSEGSGLSRTSANRVNSQPGVAGLQLPFVVPEGQAITGLWVASEIRNSDGVTWDEQHRIFLPWGPAPVDEVDLRSQAPGRWGVEADALLVTRERSYTSDGQSAGIRMCRIQLRAYTGDMVPTLYVNSQGVAMSPNTRIVVYPAGAFVVA